MSAGAKTKIPGLLIPSAGTPTLPSAGHCSTLLLPLSQGGALHFLEHVVAEPSTWTYFWQQVLKPTWYILFDGCDLMRESWKPLERAGFSKLKLQHLQAPLSIRPVVPHIYGYAVK